MGSDLRVTSVLPGVMGGPSLRHFWLVVVWRALAFWRAVLASGWLVMICEAMSVGERIAVERTFTLGRRFIFRPKVISNDESSDESPGAALITVGRWGR